MPVLNIAIKENSIDGFSENLKKYLGIDVKVTRVSYKDLILKSRKKDFDIIENEILLGFNDPILYLERFVSDSPYNYGSYSNSEYDKLIKIASETKDINIRTDALIKAENIYEKENPAAKMGYGEITHVILERPGIKGLKLVPYGGILYLRNVNKAK
jgi:4-phytase